MMLVMCVGYFMPTNIHLCSPWNGRKKFNYTNNTTNILSKSCHCSSKSVTSFFQQHARQFTTKKNSDNISQTK